MNPFHYIEAQAFHAFIMLYPQLVQYDFQDGKYVIVGDLADSWDTSADGKDWTFHLKSGKWSDGQPITAEDVAWTANTTAKYASGPTAVMAPALAHLKSAEATDPTTVVLHYKTPVGNVLAQLEQFFVVPEHVWSKFATGDGKGLKTYAPRERPLVLRDRRSLHTEAVREEGNHCLHPGPELLGRTRRTYRRWR